MRNTLILVFLCGVLLLAGTVTGQKKVSELVLQDDQTGAFLFLDLASGAYRAQQCGAASEELSGVGKLDISGCKFSLQDIQESRLVLASIDGCSNAGSASISVAVPCMRTGECPKQTITIQDNDLKDSIADCNK